MRFEQAPLRRDQLRLALDCLEIRSVAAFRALPRRLDEGPGRLDLVVAQGGHLLRREHFVKGPSHLRGQGKAKSFERELLHRDVLFGDGNLERALAGKLKELAEFEIAVKLGEPLDWIGDVLCSGRNAQLRVRIDARRPHTALCRSDTRLEGAQLRIVAERVSRQAFQRIGSRRNASQQDHDR